MIKRNLNPFCNKGKTAFITGGAGFIGSHTSLAMIEKGYVIFILDSFVNSSKKSISKLSQIL